MKHSDLDTLLRSAGSAAPVPEDFQRAVWRRIEARENETPPAPRFAGASTFRWASLAAMAATILLGAWLGLQSRPDGNQAKAEYVRSISPFVHR
ncbi:MAG: hypothetical protein ACKO2G_08785 [Verrucomicrobiales bacterium]